MGDRVPPDGSPAAAAATTRTAREEEDVLNTGDVPSTDDGGGTPPACHIQHNMGTFLRVSFKGCPFNRDGTDRLLERYTCATVLGRGHFGLRVEGMLHKNSRFGPGSACRGEQFRPGEFSRGKWPAPPRDHESYSKKGA